MWEVKQAEMVRDIRFAWYWGLTWYIDWQDLTDFGMVADLRHENERPN